MLISNYFLQRFSKLFNVVSRVIDRRIYNIETSSKKEFEFLIDNILNKGLPSSIYFNFNDLKKRTLYFVESMRVSDEVFKYKFSPSQQKDNLYSSIYACLLLDMYGELEKLTDQERKEWSDYFDSFQSSEDGLWYDINVSNELFNDTDWWGARHLAVHMIAGYTALRSKPKYKIIYVEKFYDKIYLYSWLDSFNWKGFFDHSNDVDNKIMNVAVIMQYNRDFWEDDDASKAVNNLFDYLEAKIDAETGLWGSCDVNNPYELSRCIQFAYHLLVPFLYDGRSVLFKDKILNLTLKTQNKLGGYGENFNSSACEDIDSIDLLIHLSELESSEVRVSLMKAFVWVLSNQRSDGGFVFRYNESIIFGHQILSADINESNLFATWFRTLSLLKLTKNLNLKNGYNYTKIPGY